jgi:hypothetical protein
MPNAAAVTFTYATEKPTVSSISSSHRVRPEALEALGLPPARGPFAGGTTITVRGGGFLRSGHLRCRFEDDVTDLPPFVVSLFQFFVSMGNLFDVVFLYTTDSRDVRERRRIDVRDAAADAAESHARAQGRNRSVPRRRHERTYRRGGVRRDSNRHHQPLLRLRGISRQRRDEVQRRVTGAFIFSYFRTCMGNSSDDVFCLNSHRGQSFYTATCTRARLRTRGGRIRPLARVHRTIRFTICSPRCTRR